MSMVRIPLPPITFLYINDLQSFILSAEHARNISFISISRYGGWDEQIPDRIFYFTVAGFIRILAPIVSSRGERMLRTADLRTASVPKS